MSQEIEELERKLQIAEQRALFYYAALRWFIHRTGGLTFGLLGSIERFDAQKPNYQKIRSSLENHSNRFISSHRRVYELVKIPNKVDVYLLSELTKSALAYEAEHLLPEMEIITQVKDDALVKVNPFHVVVALTQVIQNAAQQIRLTPVRKIIITTESSENGAYITVEDTGPGFTDIALLKAIEEGFTTKRDGSGTGLWLANLLTTRVDVSNREEGGGKVSLFFSSEQSS